MSGVRRATLAALIAWAWPGVCRAQAAEAPAVPVAQPWSVQARFEPVHLPGGERMGLLTASWLLAHDGWWLGPSVAAAATGQRGGLFVLGAQAGRRWAWGSAGEGPRAAEPGDRWWLDTSVFAGGGGGAGAPVGGGLMVVPSLAWMVDWGGWQTGLTWSRVSFPSGRVRSHQWGLALQWDGQWPVWGVGSLGREAGGTSGTSGANPGPLGWQRVQAEAGLLRPQGLGRLGLIGARAERDASPTWAWTLATAAAAHGGADGYMEVLAGAHWHTRDDAGRSPSVGLRAALGLGGGGAVPTGGGGVGKLGAGGRWPLAAVWPGAYVDVEAGMVAGPGGRTGDEPHAGPYRARYVQAAMGWDWSAARAEADPQVWRVRGWRASATWQRQTAAVRKDGQTAPLDTVGLKLQPDDGAGCRPLVQAHSAYAGGAGAYSLGLVGLGCATPARPWRLGVEASVGAAGGGGVATHGGAVAQAQLWLAGPAGGDSQWQVGLGRLRSVKASAAGEPALDSPVVDLSWSWRFGQLGR
ncbi:MAG: hypothetical protein RI907_2266 [Pseudomonadota bacterium]